VLAEGAAYALAFPFGYATIGLVLTLRRPANPIGWLYAASGLIWSLTIPFEPWLDQLGRDHRPLALAARLAVVAGEIIWAPAIACGITLPLLLLPDGRLRSRRWRLVVAAAVVGVAMFVVGPACSRDRPAKAPSSWTTRSGWRGRPARPRGWSPSPAWCWTPPACPPRWPA
jgi:hypothetical protein